MTCGPFRLQAQPVNRLSKCTFRRNVQESVSIFKPAEISTYIQKWDDMTMRSPLLPSSGSIWLCANQVGAADGLTLEAYRVSHE